MAETKPGEEMLAVTNPQPGVVLATVQGEVDLHNSPMLRTGLSEAIRKFKPTKLILQLSQVPYVDSSAIAVLVEMLKELRRTAGKVYLADLQPRVRGLLEIARLDSIFVVVKDEQEALSQ